jgi:hypothetical protein
MVFVATRLAFPRLQEHIASSISATAASAARVRGIRALVLVVDVVYARSGALRLEGVSRHTRLITGLRPFKRYCRGVQMHERREEHELFMQPWCGVGSIGRVVAFTCMS